MAASRDARRRAHTTARETLLAGDMGAALNHLADASATIDRAMAAVDAADGRGRDLVAAAEQQARELVDTARANVKKAQADYAAGWDTARRAGWASALLKSMGWDRPKAGWRATAPTAAPVVPPVRADGAQDTSPDAPADGAQADTLPIDGSDDGHTDGSHDRAAAADSGQPTAHA